MFHVDLALCLFFMGRESSESLLWKYLGLALLQTAVPFTKANSGNVLKTHSNNFLHHFLMGLSYSCHHPECRTDLHSVELIGVLVFLPFLVKWCKIPSTGSWCCVWEMIQVDKVLPRTDFLCTRVSHPGGQRVATLCVVS